MALRHKWLDKTQTELDETIEYVFREFGDKVAESVYVEVKACVLRLTEFPNSGLRYKDLFYQGNEVRIFHMQKSTIIYCHNNEMLFILSIWNNRRDDSKIAELLAER